MDSKQYPADCDALRKTVWAIEPLNEASWADFVACWHPITVKRKTLLTCAGEVEPYLYFVLDGVQRAFYIDDARQREITLVFAYNGSLSAIADSFLLQQPARYCLETLTSSRLLRLSYADFTTLTDRHPALLRWANKATARALSGVMDRYIELTTYTAEEKFRVLLTRSPHVLQLIPHKYLASYLSIDPTTFSKLLASVKL